MKILAFPRDANPYQELLYGEVRRLGDTVEYLEGPTRSHTLNLLLIPILLASKRVHGFDVVHLHWTYEFRLPWLGAVGRLLMEVYVCCFIILVKAADYRLVWTVHNIVPHERQFPHGSFVRRFLAKHSDAMIVHSMSVLLEMYSLHYPTDHVSVIAHGSYVGAYEDNVSRPNARAALGIPGDAFVYLFFGQIRRYKGVEHLLDAFTRMDNPGAILVIAGRCSDKDLTRTIGMYKARLGGRLVVSSAYVRDEDVQYYFRSSDVAVLPLDKASTSGSVILSLSFGCPVIAPLSAAVADLPRNVGLFYNSDDSHGLEEMMRLAADDRERLRSAASRGSRYAEALSWSEIAAQTHEVYRQAMVTWESMNRERS